MKGKINKKEGKKKREKFEKNKCEEEKEIKLN